MLGAADMRGVRRAPGGIELALEAGELFFILRLHGNLRLLQLVDLGAHEIHLLQLRSELALHLAGATSLILKLLADLVKQLLQAVGLRAGDHAAVGVVHNGRGVGGGTRLVASQLCDSVVRRVLEDWTGVVAGARPMRLRPCAGSSVPARGAALDGWAENSAQSRRRADVCSQRARRWLLRRLARER